MNAALRPRGISSAAFAAFMEAYEDNPAEMETLCSLLGRAARPAFGATTIRYQKGRIVLLDKQETIKVD